MASGDGSGRHTALVDRLVLTALRTPVLNAVLDHGLCQLRYRGRRTGRPVALPVQYARHGADVVVYVGAAAGKSWWRNFATPYPVEVEVRGERYTGIGRLVRAGTPDRARISDIYRGQHPRARFVDTDPFVHIALRPERGRQA
ncbi:nitroreductase/quinone reductase family protein [Phytohabitans suffuscus]|uniref:Nitroreductase n=1 Tax=Phytohabitans suffuscus TaxID=624315 RepID=A0A6F8YAL4_9ACTN|nr:nitroreductase/quinone reductase family protein [Phytohabitans suffuscus]BCB83107.1 hypothetical protein Psuf_004200 [Phytohabitans suffuscus]